MRINCVGLADLLCAYADGELTDANKQLVEDHLAICDNCTSILKIYREISTAVNDTCVEAPPELVAGVMNRIINEDIPRVEKETVQRKRNRFILTRYIPVAACLVAALLVWQFWGNTWFTGQVGDAMPAASPMEVYDAPEPSAAAGMPAADSSPETIESENGGLDRLSDSSSLSIADADYNIPEDDILRQLGEADESFDLESIVDFISGAYAEIAISGEVPEFLLDFTPLSFKSPFGWELIFELPRPDVFPFIAALGDRKGVNVVYNENDSEYAVVLITP